MYFLQGSAARVDPPLWPQPRTHGTGVVVMPRRHGSAAKKRKKKGSALGAAADDRGTGVEVNEVSAPVAAATKDVTSESADHELPMSAVAAGPPLSPASASVELPKAEDAPANGETGPVGTELAEQDTNVSGYSTAVYDVLMAARVTT